MVYYKDTEGNLIKVPMKEGADSLEFIGNQAVVRFALVANRYPKPATAVLAVVK